MQELDFRIFRNTHAILSGSAGSVLRWDGMEFLQLAEYSWAENSRHIDWKASVRSGKMKVREYARDHDVKLIVVADIGASMWFWRISATKMDLEIEILSVLGNAAQSQGNSFGAILFDEKELFHFKPTRSPAVFRELFPLVLRNKEKITSQKRISQIISELWTYKIGKSPVFFLVDTPFEITSAFLSLCRTNTVFVLLLRDDLGKSGVHFLRDASWALVSHGGESWIDTVFKEFSRKLSEIGAISETFVAGEPPLPTLISLFHRAHGKH